MNKIDKLDKELEKAREKAAEWQAKIRELEKQKQEEENSQIVQAVRSQMCIRDRPHRGDLGMRGIYGVAVFYLIQNRQSCKIHLRLPLRDFGPC